MKAGHFYVPFNKENSQKNWLSDERASSVRLSMISKQRSKSSVEPNFCACSNNDIALLGDKSPNNFTHNVSSCGTVYFRAIKNV